ncbi:FMN-binding negative transcriptional regulator [Pollutibacter soli]|uniref:FMN-binding negative transcriptional regulator n=1 Tax=Pollutibacter soli TaxID=3034157 RepID=UPI0030136115
MYSLPYFKEQDAEKVLAFMRANPFAMLIGVGENNVPAATQVPLFIEEKDGKLWLSGHIMKQTDHHKVLLKNPQALVVFTGAHTYVSASWYTNPQQASTWNYISVHVRGKLYFRDHDFLLTMLKKTTDHFENNPHSPAGFDQLPKEYVERLSKAIEAFEIEVESIENIFKLSQNRDEKSYHNIINKLEDQGGEAAVVAEEMKKRSVAGNTL